MDQQISEYLNQLTAKCLEDPAFSSLESQKKAEVSEKIRSRLYDSILDLVVDNLTDNQVQALQHVDPNSDEMQQKLTEFSATIPDLATKIEQKLDSEILEIKNDPHSITQ